MTELIAYSFGAAAVMWITGYVGGLAAGFIRRIRDVV
jgi:hypothetical protein